MHVSSSLLVIACPYEFIYVILLIAIVLDKGRFVKMNRKKSPTLTRCYCVCMEYCIPPFPVVIFSISTNTHTTVLIYGPSHVLCLPICKHLSTPTLRIKGVTTVMPEIRNNGIE